jgi:hypothetical protein
MVRPSPHVVSARLTPQQLAAVRARAAAKNVTLSEYLRACTAVVTEGDGDAALAILDRAGKLASTGDDPAGTLASLIADLGLPDDAAPADVLAAVKALVDALGTAPDGTAPEHADPAAPGALSRATLAAIKAKGWTVDRFHAEKRSVTRRAGAK